MKNKKFLALACASILMLGAFTACGSKDETTPDTDTPAGTETETNSSELQDGTYRVEYDKEDSRGWKSFLEVTVADGSITEVVFDDINADGAFKSEDEEYNNQMKEIAGTNPAEFTTALEEALIEAGSADVDTITGATSSSDVFKTFAAEALKQAAAGNTETVIIEQPAE